LGLLDFFEKKDAKPPQPVHINDELGRKFPIAAFSFLSGGDAFEQLHGTPPPEGRCAALSYIENRIQIRPHRASSSIVDRVRADLVHLLEGSVALSRRLIESRPLTIDLIPEGQPFAKYGFPKSSNHAIGLFWDDPRWPEARIALRQEEIGQTETLVFHEMAHAIHHMAFTQAERELIHRALVRTWRTTVLIDEVFAIYSEREFVKNFSDRDKLAPGVYGAARIRWSENHMFAHFVRHLYAPYKPLARSTSRLP
jgi:hypothetical protein